MTHTTTRTHGQTRARADVVGRCARCARARPRTHTRTSPLTHAHAGTRTHTRLAARTHTHTNVYVSARGVHTDGRSHTDARTYTRTPHTNTTHTHSHDRTLKAARAGGSSVGDDGLWRGGGGGGGGGCRPNDGATVIARRTAHDSYTIL